MKVGVSTYSLSRLIESGDKSVVDVIGMIAEMGGEHAEIVPIGFRLEGDPGLVEAIRRRAEDSGIALSNYAVYANFSDLDDAAYEEEINRVMAEVDVAHALGVKLMRHDAAFSSDTSIGHFLAELPRLAEACGRIADYAASFGITTSLENHGYYIQSSDRVQAVVNEVNRSNYKTTLDVGNFLCVDEDPVCAVKNNMAYASMVHVKDFYYRPSFRNPGEGWFGTAGGNWLRGAIAGHGDIDLPEVLRVVKQAGFDGYLSIEFEGMEDCAQGTKLGLDYVKRILSEI
jgi:sugar phosphate isomerase/epimerase